MILNLKHIYFEPEAASKPAFIEIVESWPNANYVQVKSHWRIPELHENKELLSKWAYVKRNYLVVGNKRKFTFQPNGRSTDFIGPSVANGCASACTYCYVARRKGYANPITVFANRDEMINAIKAHISTLGVKTPNQTHPTLWTYDIGCNNDISIDAQINNTPAELIAFFSQQDKALASFATKTVNYDMLEYNPRGKTRIRFSLMPESLRKVVDIGTSTTVDKLQAAESFLATGYEVHFNLSPVIVVEGGSKDWLELFEQMNQILPQKVKDQAACEIIFLTHNEKLHVLNQQWHPKAESILWAPHLQEQKLSNNGAVNLRYKRHLKAQYISYFVNEIKTRLPWLKIRYYF